MKYWLSLFVLVTGLPAVAATNPADFTVIFTVASAYTPADSGCFMTLEADNVSYDVVNSGFRSCHVFLPGTLLPGRFHKYGKQGIELYAQDEHGKPKAFWCVIRNTTYLHARQ